jgi:hypothetical protein
VVSTISLKIRIWSRSISSKEVVMVDGRGGGPVAARQPKHQEILTAFFHLRCIIDRVDAFLGEVRGVAVKIEKDPNPQPDGPEPMSLGEFMSNAQSRLQEQTERLERILSELREELI